MSKHSRMSTILPVAMAAMLLVWAAPIWAGDDDDDDGGVIPFNVATIYFELNDTDGDLGIHALIDGEPWKILEIEAPNGRNNP